MAYFAKLNTENIVLTVVSVNNNIIIDSNGIEQESLGVEFLKNLYNEPNSIWKKTSYNSLAGKYYYQDENNLRILGDQSKVFRKNFAGVGYTYDKNRDAFIPPKPYPSWILNEYSCCWEAPIPMPSELNVDGTPPRWNEATLQWIFVK